MSSHPSIKKLRIARENQQADPNASFTLVRAERYGIQTQPTQKKRGGRRTYQVLQMSVLSIAELASEIKVDASPIPAPQLSLVRHHYKRVITGRFRSHNLDNETPGQICRRDISSMVTQSGTVEIKENYYGDS